MKQLCFNDDFSEIIDSFISNYWKRSENIPIELLNFIKEKSNLLPIKSCSDGNNYCQKCYKQLDNKNYCKNCSIRYDISREDECIFVDSIDNLDNEIDNIYYYYFDVIDNNVFLYKIKEKIYFDNPFVNTPYKTSKLSIDNAFLVMEYGLYDLNIKKTYYYDTDEYSSLAGDDICIVCYVYPNNINNLKNTIYKYSSIWKSIDYLKNNTVQLDSLTYIPLKTSEFEFSMKNGLFNLGYSFYNGEKIKYEKDYLNYVKENNLSFEDYIALSLSDVYDVKFLKGISDNLYTKHLKDKKINYKKVKDYFDSKKINYIHLSEYFDYIEYADKLGLNMKDRKVLYPDDLMKEHDKLFDQYEIISNKKHDDKINKLSKLLEINNYDDNKYIIYPAHSVKELIEESRMQNNCVKTYVEKYSNNETQIYFMRKKDNINKSFVTVEVYKGKVIQARLKNNESITDDIKTILMKWEKSLIVVKD